MAKKKPVKILAKRFVTHDVRSFLIEKPKGYEYNPGQATMVAINRKGLKEEDRPFTFTSLNKDKTLEFTIKGYYDHDGVTKKIHQLGPGDELLIGNPWGTIEYKGEGTFIAGGAGVTPFIAILRDLNKKGKIGKNKLFFSNKTQKDIILEKEFKSIFSKNPNNLVLTLTREEKPNYKNSLINKGFLKKYIDDFSQNFYVCGPPAFNEDIMSALKSLGAKPKALVFEE